MAKIPAKRNILRELVLTSSEKEYGKQAIQGLIKSLLEPLMEQTSSEGLVLMRLFNTDGISSVIKRLEFSDVKIYSYCDNLAGNKIINIEKENIWDTTEFILILAPRYSAVLIWDWALLENDMSQICFIMNSREISDIANIMFDNSSVALANYLTTYAPDRREQKTMNIAINKIAENYNSVSQEMAITLAEQENYDKSEDLLNEFEQISEKAKMTSHEIKNHISVIDLYTKIIERRIQNVSADNETLDSIKNAIESIKQANFSINSFISDLRTFSKPILTDRQLSSIVESVVTLASPKANEKGIALEAYVDSEYRVSADTTRLQSILLNLIYNAIDSIESKGRITLKVEEKENNKLALLVRDSGKGIQEEDVPHIFDEGFTTKIDGNGLGLYICKRLANEQYCELNLTHTGKDGTEFELLIPKA